MSENTTNDGGAALAGPVVIHQLKTSDIGPSPWNRTHFDQAALDQLTASVKERGVLHAASVRLNPGYVSTELSGSLAGSYLITSKTGMRVAFGLTQDGAAKRVEELNRPKYELIAGERRWRAAAAAGKDLPAVIKEASDQQAIEEQGIENADREDLNPIEEGEKCIQIRDMYVEQGMGAKAAVEAVGKLLGMAVSTVYERMKLVELEAGFTRAQVLANRIPPSHAKELQKIDDVPLRDKVARELLESKDKEEGEKILPIRPSRRVVERALEYLEQRREYDRLKVEFEKKKWTVLPAKQVSKVLHEWGNVKNGYYAATENICANGKYVEVGKVLGKDYPGILVWDERNGRYKVVYEQKAAEHHLVTVKKMKLGYSSGSGGGSGKKITDADRKRQAEHRVRRGVFDGIFAQLAEAAENNDSPELWRIAFHKHVRYLSQDFAKQMCRRRGLEVGKGRPWEVLTKWLKSATGKQMRGAFFEAMFVECAPGSHCSKWGDTLTGYAETFGVKLPPFKVDVQTAGTAADKATPKAGKPALQKAAKDTKGKANKEEARGTKVKTEEEPKKLAEIPQRATSGEIVEKMLELVRAAGADGISAQDLAAKLNTKRGDVHVWMALNAKQQGIKRLRAGVFAFEEKEPVSEQEGGAKS